MNCPSRTDDTLAHPGWNQNPPPFNADTTTRNDFNGLANSRVHRRHAASSDTADNALSINDRPLNQQDRDPGKEKIPSGEVTAANPGGESPPGSSESPRLPFSDYLKSSTLHCARTLAKFGRFVGPGFLIAVAYIDPGNYATDVAAGAEFKYALLFIVLISNLFAILLQSLCIKLGSVTGLNLAENCREHLPKWVTIFLYILAEAAIVATDIAEVSDTFSTARPLDDYTNDLKGGWISDCLESIIEYPFGSWLCHHSGGCSLHSYFLSAQWGHVGTPTIRILCNGFGVGCGRLLLHSALTYSRPVGW
jgi:hypothetical protein